MSEENNAVKQPEKPVEGPLKSERFLEIDDQSIIQILPGEMLTVESNNGIVYTIHYEGLRIMLIKNDFTV